MVNEAAGSEQGYSWYMDLRMRSPAIGFGRIDDGVRSSKAVMVYSVSYLSWQMKQRTLGLQVLWLGNNNNGHDECHSEEDEKC